MSKITTDIYIVEEKYGYIFLDSQTMDSKKAMDPFKFRVLLVQSFTEDQIKKIIEALSLGKKLIIDFDKDRVKGIEEKEERFENAFLETFSKEAVQEWWDTEGFASTFYN